MSKPLIQLIGILSFQLCKSSDTETNSFTWLKSRSPISNLKLKCMASCLSLNPYYTLLQLRYLPIMLISIKGMQIGDHEIKWVNFAEDTTIVLRDITYLNRIQVILKLYEDASSSKINFSKLKPYMLVHIKIELINKINGTDRILYRIAWT